jgi:predicted KAP-like P-loop ATPase
MSDSNIPRFDSDGINGGDRIDRLGFQPIAEKLCVSVLDQATAGGIVIGIEGKWGCGKSSLMRRIETELTKREDAPEIVNFAPWLIRSRDALIEGLISELSDAARKIDAEAERASANHGKSRARRTTKEKIRGAAEALAKYGSSVGRLGKLAKVAEAILPGAGTAGSVLEIGADLLASLGQPKELQEQEAAAQALAALSRRIVVFVDDLDRLEPMEIAEVLRLVRAVADFPNVIYVLAYERKAVTSAMEAVLRVEDGSEYLEKFIQVNFKVPSPEDFNLRRWFRDEASTIISTQLSAARESDRREISRRLDEYIDRTGGRCLRTPRDVVRTLNALKLYGPPIADVVDIPDLVWLQLVRTNDPALCDWTEAYMIAAAQVAYGASVSDNEIKRTLERLKSLLEQQGLELDDVIWELHDMLPGINFDTNVKKNPDGWKLFDRISDKAVRKWEARRRLGSPQHYRYYFALVQPEGIVSDVELMKLITSSATSYADLAALFHKAATTKRAIGGVALDPLLSRLLSLDKRELPVETIPNILLALGDVVDDASRLCGVGQWGVDWLAVTAERAFRELLRRAPIETPSHIIGAVFSRGKALGWIAGLLTDDILARGLAGGEHRGSHEPFFTEDEFENAKSLLIRRIRAEPPENIMEVPRLPSILYTWKRLSNDEEVRNWCSERTRTDEGLLEFLSKSRGWVSSSSLGIYYPLNKQTISDFIDYDDAVARVQKLAGSAKDRRTKELAEELTVAFQQGAKD